jgi:hypothetical protein
VGYETLPLSLLKHDDASIVPSPRCRKIARYEGTDARLALKEREPLATSGTDLQQLAGAPTKLAAVEAGNVEGTEGPDGSAEVSQQDPAHAVKRWRLVALENTGVRAAGILGVEGKGAIALKDCHADHASVLIVQANRIASD